MPLIYVVRHGQASFGSENYDRLSENGIKQSEVLGCFFKKAGIYFDEIYCGSLLRQTDTASIVLKAMKNDFLTPYIIDGLNEYDHSALIHSAADQLQEIKDGLGNSPESRKKFQKLFSKIVNSWIKKELFSSGLPTYEAYCGNVLSAFEKITLSENRKKKICVFTSGGPVSVLLENSLEITPLKAVEIGWGLRNCSISVFSSSGSFQRAENKMRMNVFNSVFHFHENKNKNLITYR